MPSILLCDRCWDQFTESPGTLNMKKKDPRQGDQCIWCGHVYDWVQEKAEDDSHLPPWQQQSIMRRIMPPSTLTWRPPTAVEEMAHALQKSV